MNQNLQGMPQIFSEYQDNGFVFNGYTNQDLQEYLETCDHVADNHDEAVKMVISAIRKAKQDGKYSSKSIKDNVMLWVNSGITNVDGIRKFEKSRQTQKFGYGQSKVENMPDWENQEIEAVSEEEFTAAWDKLKLCRLKRKEQLGAEKAYQKVPTWSEMSMPDYQFKYVNQ